MSLDLKIFSGSSGNAFAQKICDYLDVPLAKSDVFNFSEGNTFVRVGETVRGEDVYIVQSIGMHPNDEFVEILFWIDALKRASAHSVTVVMPFFSYAKGDKKDEPRVSIRARVCADCIEVTGADRVVTMDLHSPQIQGFFKKPVDHLTALPVFAQAIRRLNLGDFVIVSPDAGYVKEARKLSKMLGVSTVIGDKTREDHSECAEILELIGDVNGKNAVIVDDFTITGGTIFELTKVLQSRGANRVIACLSHVMLNESAIQWLEESAIEKLLCTDTVDNPHIRSSSKIQVISVAPLFAETIKRIHNKESVSVMFETLPDEVDKEIKRIEQVEYKG
ncbi:MULTISPECIES: ribose-phosphate pyrophosphokinase [unclassified Fusibacter]|uniref:ribose-phosphate diphosphokinase n=1 Tax=unclassified Fusibacter TaxID=2624464 RepID=UPI001010614E|nr:MULTISPECIES: ribose-phosphate diphosphokinase [unclassified Fusibacter]MCK8060782.1 ribose-phosphate diphosphokinase [Fusibacter sp. A2]NPE23078.1 ribose-phosphate diphosphokinase [Fusibacter sp. A1]RXV59748.1 ribose-phosphate diphosphokinase [Fusibacter sp. A1]